MRGVCGGRGGIRKARTSRSEVTVVWQEEESHKDIGRCQVSDAMWKEHVVLWKERVVERRQNFDLASLHAGSEGNTEAPDWRQVLW